MKLSSVVEAAEIVSFSVEGKVIILGEPFLAGNDWLRTLKVRMRNVSGRTITLSQMDFYLPESRKEGKGAISFRLVYGSVPSENPKLIEPGQDFELSMTELNPRCFGLKSKRDRIWLLLIGSISQ